MFVGIVSLSKVHDVQHIKNMDHLFVVLGPEDSALAANLQKGASIAINGTCLTVVSWETISDVGVVVRFDVMMESLKKTNLGALSAGDYVNVERSLRFGDEIGGHLVSGHVDGRGTISAVRKSANNQEVEISYENAAWDKFLIPKGYVAIDGASITVVDTFPGKFTVSLIPETLARSTLGKKGEGSAVNLEFEANTKLTVAAMERLQASTAPNSAASTGFSSIPDAIAAFKRGELIVVMDDEDRENEGDLICAASTLTEEQAALIVRYTSGIVCAPMDEARAIALHLPAMVGDNRDPNKTNFTVTCDAVGTTTGVSARDRTLTIRTLADSAATPESLRRPGHVFPLVARAGGVLERRGHTEAAVDLCRLAGLPAVGVLCELTHDSGEMMRLPACQEFAKKNSLHLITIEALAAYRRSHGGEDASTVPGAPAVQMPGGELGAYKAPVLKVPSGAEVQSARVAIVRTSWNGAVVGALEQQCMDSFIKHGVQRENIVCKVVPGSYELPLACQRAAKSGQFDAVVAVGVLIKGETMHFEVIAEAVTQGLMRVQLDTGVPVVFGVLTCMTKKQAEERAAPDSPLAATWAESALIMAFP